MRLVRATAAALVLATTASAAATGAQAPAGPAGGTDGEISVAQGSRRHVVARVVAGRIAAAAPCVVAEGPLDAMQDALVTAPTPLDVLTARQVRVGTGEWNRVAPLLLTLADRREREQRLAPETTSRVPRFLDWLYASDAGGRPVYYFETSRRVPSPPADPDAADLDPPGTLRVAVSGFAVTESNGATPLGTKGELRWEEDGLPRGPSRPDLRPLGIVRTADGPVWVMEGRTPAGSTISLFTAGARGTALLATTRIGRC